MAEPEEKPTPEEPEDAGQKTFTQSDFDRHIAREKRRIEEKYGDYDNLKTQVDTLLDEKKKRDEAEMTENERAQAKITELEKKVIELSHKNVEYQKLNTKGKVLSDPKYAQLPRAYKEVVSASDNLDEVIKSADEALEEWKRDTNQQIKDTFGLPKDEKKPTVITGSPADWGKALKERMNAIVKDRNEAKIL